MRAEGQGGTHLQRGKKKWRQKTTRRRSMAAAMERQWRNSSDSGDNGGDWPGSHGDVVGRMAGATGTEAGLLRLRTPDLRPEGLLRSRGDHAEETSGGCADENGAVQEHHHRKRTRSSE
ncbi:UNVERIFIED_CONTAM: hypothetical protein K2H54_058690 [Gekko kuhli]